MNDYAAYLVECMRAGRKGGHVGESINRIQLRAKHFFNKKSDAIANKGKDFFSPYRALEMFSRLILLTLAITIYSSVWPGH